MARLARRTAAFAALLGILAAGPAAFPQEPEGPIKIEVPKLDRPVDFQVDVLPILKTGCLACHNAKDAEAGVVLETPKTILKGGDEGPIVVPGKADQSVLIRVASRLKKPHMPPPKNKAGAKPLAPKELGILKLWIDQGAQGTVQRTIDPPKWQPPPAGWNPVYAVTLDAEGQVAACGRAGRLFIYHVPTGRLIDQPADAKLAPSGAAHLDAVHAAAFSPDGTLLATGGYRSIKIWKKETPERKAAFDLGEAATASLSRDGARLAAAFADGTVKILATADGKGVSEIKVPGGAVPSLRFSPDGAALLTGGADKFVRAWKVADGSPLGQIETPAAVGAVEWIGDGKQVASGGADGVIRIWATPDPKALLKPAEPGKEPEKAPAPAPVKELKGHTGPVTALVFAGQLVSASQDGRAILWNLENGQVARQVSHGAPVVTLAVSPDGKRWVTVAGTGVAKLWNGENAQAIADLRTDGGAKRRDQYLASLAAFMGNEVAYRQQQVTAAGEGKKKEEDEVKKATEAVAAPDKGLKEKQEAMAKARQDRETAENALAEAGKTMAAAKAKAEALAAVMAIADPAEALKKSEGLGETGAKLAAWAKARIALPKAEADVAAASKPLPDLAKAVDPAKAAAASKAAAEAKAKLDPGSKAAAEAKAKLEAAEQALKAAGEDEAKKKEAEAKKKSAEEALKKAEAEKAAAAQASEKAEKEKQAADASLAAAVKARDEAKAKAAASDAALQQAKTAHDQAKKAAEADKAAADQAAKTAETQQKTAETNRDNAKKNEETATAALEQARQLLESANRRTEKARENVVRADQSIKDAEAKQEAVKKDQQQVDADKKKAAEELTKAQRGVRAAAFTADGALVALGAEDGRLHTFGAEKGDEAATVAAHGKPVLAIGPGAGALVSAAADGARIGAVLPAWKLQRTIEPPAGDAAQPPIDRVTALSFSPDGKWLASGGGVPSREGELLLWSVADGRVAREIKDAHSDSIYALEFSWDGTLLATGSADKFAKVFEAATGKHVRSFEGHTYHVLGVGWNRTGRTLATAGADNVVKVWNLDTGQQIRTIQGFDKQVTSLRYLGFGTSFVVTAGGTQARVVGENGQTVRNFDTGGAFLYAASLSADGAVLAAGGLDGTLRLWRSDNGQSIGTFPAPEAK